jgi:hypothetical protein
LTDAKNGSADMGVNFGQGSFVTMDNGTCWFLFHDNFMTGSPYGRRTYLAPAGWGTDNWPTIGIDIDGDGRGEPVALTTPYAKPISGYGPYHPEPANEFSDTTLNCLWMWNHDPDNTKWSLTARPGWMRLTAKKLNTSGGYAYLSWSWVNFHEDELLFAYNTLVTRPIGKTGTYITCMSTNNMIDGQRAGLTIMVKDYEWIGVAKDNGVKTIQWVKGNDVSGNTATVTGPTLGQDLVYLKLTYNQAKGTMSYSLDGVSYTNLGDENYAYYSAWYEAHKVGIFAYNKSTTTPGGSVDFDYFRVTHDGATSTRNSIVHCPALPGIGKRSPSYAIYNLQGRKIGMAADARLRAGGPVGLCRNGTYIAVVEHGGARFAKKVVKVW